jgi:hypothetical protein
VAYAATIGRVGGLLSSLLGAFVIQAGAKTYWLVLAIAMVCAFAGLAWVRSHYPAIGRPETVVGTASMNLGLNDAESG